MGLDMYLKKRIYVGSQCWRDVTGEIVIKAKGDHLNINFKKVKYVVEDAGYWRKANAIHKWFVDNVQNGKDNCRRSYVPREKLQELLDICKAIGKSKKKAQELLPTQAGFFFGSQEYDEYYFQDIQHTIKICEDALADEDGEYYYQSSW